MAGGEGSRLYPMRVCKSRFPFGLVRRPGSCLLRRLPCIICSKMAGCQKTAVPDNFSWGKLLKSRCLSEHMRLLDKPYLRERWLSK